MDTASIVSLCTGVASVVGSIAASVIFYRKGKQAILAERTKMEAEKAKWETEREALAAATKTKDAKARSKLAQEEHDFIVAKWQELYATVERKVDKLSQDHLQCEVKLATVTTELHEVRERIRVLEAQQQGHFHEPASD